MSNGFKPGWIYYQLVEAKPPLHIWEKFAELRGYKKSWAKYRYEEQEGIQTQEDVSANEATVEEIWQSVVERLHPMLKILLQTHAHLVGIKDKTACLTVKSEPVFNIMQSHTSDIEATLSLVMGQPVFRTNLEIIKIDSKIVTEQL